ncbi:zymogen granule membrane protein 16-like [Xyrichtys novacula]|uniref:Zymogen granule membrane protein 16-like n=1 Tax=Xyrichtys novacula TaxID=13765 RepID=A0AAV1HDS5_XYRNO|nr:zymogen granule membrane protein 16-like [Xyrichtys novacula]
MHYIVLAALLSACVLADVQPQYYSFSPSVGSGSGTAYSLTGEGRITGVRVWDANNNYIYGIQFRYGYVWSPVVGFQSGDSNEILLHDDEAIVQVSGKYGHYVQSLVFITNKGRSLFAGQPSGRSFNMYPANSRAELRFLSGRYHGAITSIGAHWGMVYQPSNSTDLM